MQESSKLQDSLLGVLDHQLLVGACCSTAASISMVMQLTHQLACIIGVWRLLSGSRSQQDHQANSNDGLLHHSDRHCLSRTGSCRFGLGPCLFETIRQVCCRCCLCCWRTSETAYIQGGEGSWGDLLRPAGFGIGQPASPTSLAHLSAQVLISHTFHAPTDHMFRVLPLVCGNRTSQKLNLGQACSTVRQVIPNPSNRCLIARYMSVLVHGKVLQLTGPHPDWNT